MTTRRKKIAQVVISVGLTILVSFATAWIMPRWPIYRDCRSLEFGVAGCLRYMMTGTPPWAMVLYVNPLVEAVPEAEVVKVNQDMRIGTIVPGSAFSIRSPDGRVARIDFGGAEVIYSGELPVAESARIFFDAVHHWLPACKTATKDGEATP